jgi:hypothetical protein
MFGTLRSLVMRRLKGSTTAVAIFPVEARALPLSSLFRVSAAPTSVAVISVPSANFTSVRRRTIHVLPSTRSTSVASQGAIRPFLLTI